MHFKLLLATATVAGSLFLSVGFAADAQARVSCSFSGAPTNLLTVKVDGESDAQIYRRRSEILVGDFLEPPKHCSGGVPTVFNTDTIKLAARGVSSADLLLRGGPFAPGASP